MNDLGTQILTTDRLILRPFTLEDAPAMFHNWAGDPTVVTHLTWPAHPDITTTATLLTQWVADYQKPLTFHWALALTPTPDQVIGDIAIVRQDDQIDSCEIGYVLGKDYWGQGYMTEALVAVSHFLLTQVGYRRVCLRHSTANPASGRVMQKAGFHYEGTLRQAVRDNQGISDMAVYSLLPSDLSDEAPSYHS